MRFVALNGTTVPFPSEPATFATFTRAEAALDASIAAMISAAVDSRTPPEVRPATLIAFDTTVTTSAATVPPGFVIATVIELPPCR